ncbi:hypothetical protein J7T55_003348 [Diaporthe amygdali]|uniref:uncharacterized protein n=1 Tax=Phomopsis amygdali TaxID=1214568 RepID=UPI0022FE095C|nr:uncharacterized protein J7T55_003348 [Diaporthe amygdali]KAJ0116934.1 hypothetical protein J7T55_003348 [Diaporthe amygdali]
MSGMEPLVALSLACNVLQLVEVGQQTINLIKVVYRGGSPDQTLDQNAAILWTARDLREEIQFLVGNAKQGSLASTLKVVARTNWRRRRLERLKESLQGAEKLMQTGLLTRIWSSTSNAELNLKDLKGDLRSFIEQSRNGHRSTKELVSRESIDIKNHVLSASAETNEALERVHQSLGSLVLDTGVQVNQAKRDCLLRSLKYQGFNERQNQVSEAYGNTGSWIFAGDCDGVDGIEGSAASSSDGINPGTTESEGARRSPSDLSNIKWDSFSNWLRSTDKFYWISGKPGSGKSTLVKSILDHADTQKYLDIWQPGSLIISHFFWRPGTALQQDIKGLLCSLLYQLLRDSTTALNYVLSSVPHSNAKDSDTDWSTAELRTLCLKVLQAYDRPSINKGVEYGDNKVTFQERIDKLPGDLVSLYKDMWKRACEDDPLAYRQTAALYFKLMLSHRKRWPPFSLFRSFGLLSFMLASTSTADRILQAGDKVPELFSEDLLLQRCQEVERKADVYCFGLIELGPRLSHNPDRIEATGLYGSKYDKLIPFTSGDRILRFIHRTAHDFLVDTPEGREILDFDKSSEMSLEIRIIKAYLAGSQLFVHGDDCVSLGASFAGVPLCLIRSVRLIHWDTNDWIETDWRDLVQICENLCNSGKLFAGSHGRARLCRGEDFLKAVANTCGDERIFSAIRSGKLSKDTKSEILLNACNIFLNGYGSLMGRDCFVEETVRMLLKDGADPNYKGVMFSPDLWRWPFAQVETPFTEYLESTLMLANDRLLSSEELFAILKTLHIYISYEANLDEIITFSFDFKRPVPQDRKESVWELEIFLLVQINWGYPSLVPVGEENSVLFVSFPAHDVLDALLHTMREKYPQPAGSKEFLEKLVFLENKCSNWLSREKACVFGRVCFDEVSNASEEPAWLETTLEYQGRIASQLLIQLKNWHSITPALRNRGRSEIDVEMMEPLLSLCAQAPWVLKARGRDAIWVRFEELGIFTRVDDTCELHSTVDWVRKR